MNFHISFFNVESLDDMKVYLSDVLECGGEVVAAKDYVEISQGYAEVKVEDREAFIAKFRETDTFQHTNLCL